MSKGELVQLGSPEAVYPAHKALRDVDAIFAAASAELATDASSTSSARRRDAVGFAVAFKGVFLEGIELVLIVVRLGASQHRLGIAAGAAGAAALVVAVIGTLVAEQLSQVPDCSGSAKELAPTGPEATRPSSP
jgi:uncharacterized membrane protein